MIRLEFSAEEQQALDYKRYHHPHPRVQRKNEFLYITVLTGLTGLWLYWRVLYRAYRVLRDA